jgi:hypothetical protein
MEHIKTPVGILHTDGKYVLYDDEGYLAEVHSEPGYGPGVAVELRDIINAYDALIAQRDALVEACELLCIAGERYSKESDYTSGRFIMDVAVITAEARDALALVREDDDGD